jgi:ABC-type antimicrobial peptide transport system permease subunit
MLKFVLRTLWRHRFFTLLHIAGLAIGLSAAWVVWQFSSFEWSHNRAIPDDKRVFRVVSNYFFDGKGSGNSGVPEPLSRAAEMLAGVEKSIPVRDQSALLLFPEGAKKPFLDIRQITQTTPEYFDMVPYGWLAGSPAIALTQPNQVVLTRSRAEKYFPRHRPDEMLSKNITYHFFRDTINAEVVGVVEDLDFPTSFIGKEFITVTKPKKDNWSGVSSGTQLWLVLQKNADPRQVETIINEVSAKHAGDELKKRNITRSHALQALADVHFDPKFESHIRAANPKVLAVLSGIAAFLVLLACINYLNLSTAQIPQRAREIGIRKTLGGHTTGIVGVFLVETLIVCLLAVVISFFLTKWAFTTFHKELPAEVLRYTDWRATALFLAALVATVTLISGLYPGWLIGRFQAISLLRGQFLGQKVSQNSRGGLRKTLIVFQFFIAQIFIIGALVVGRQLNFMLSKDLGFDREAVVLTSVPFRTLRDAAYQNSQFRFAEALRKLPEVEDVALGEPLLSLSYSSNKYFRTDENGQKFETVLYQKLADTSLVSFYRLPVLAGRNLPAGDTIREFVINETAARAFGFERPADALGQFVTEQDGAAHEVVGVVADFHNIGFEARIQPVAFMADPSNLTDLNIKLASRQAADWSEALRKIEAVWAEIYPNDVFEHRFYDQTLEDIYAADLSMTRFINLATGIAIFISCLGLFGLATFTAVRRKKEIGIRKVLGASAASVLGLLTKELLMLVVVGFALAVPLAIFFLKKWLDNYVYRVELEWWLVALAGAATVFIAFLTLSFQSLRAALANPVKSLRSE